MIGEHLAAGNIDRVAEFSKVECRDKFAVAADPGAVIAKRYDAVNPGNPERSSRTSYVIAADGTVAAVHSEMDPSHHVKAMLDALDALPGR